MRKVLVTGANGFTGSRLLKYLESEDWEILPMVHRGIGHKNEIVADFNSVEFSRLVQQLPPVDALVHLGAKVGWDGSNAADLFGPNVMATGELARWANQNKTYFVYASAALIAGLDNPCITQDAADRPQNDYLTSKFLAEQLIKMSGVKHAILRISGIFGADGPDHLGMNRSISQAMSGHRPVQTGNGEIKRNYIYVKDLCRILSFCLENRQEGTYLVAGSQVNTVAEMLDSVCRVFLPGQKPIKKPGRPGHDQVVIPSEGLPGGLSFEQALQDIKENHGQE